MGWEVCAARFSSWKMLLHESDDLLPCLTRNFVTWMCLVMQKVQYCNIPGYLKKKKKSIQDEEVRSGRYRPWQVFFFNQRKLFEHKSLYFIPCIIYFHTPGDGWLCISVGTVICGPSHCGVSCTTGNSQPLLVALWPIKRVEWAAEPISERNQFWLGTGRPEVTPVSTMQKEEIRLHPPSTTGL